MLADSIDATEAIRGRLRGTFAISLATHVLCLSFFFIGHGSRPIRESERPSWMLGYSGEGQDARRLDLLQANAIRFRIFQPAAGAQGSRGAQPRASLQARKRDDIVQAPEAKRATADGVRASRRAPPPRPKDGDAGGKTGEKDAASVPALQPDVARGDDLVILKLIKPTYPERELQAGVSAKLWVAIHVAPTGEIDALEVRRAEATPVGSTRAFELTALEALRQWRVRLPTAAEYQNGMWLTVPIEYSPSDANFDRLEELTPEAAPEPGASPTM